MSKGFYAILSFCIFGFCLYFKVLNGEFISDDLITIVHNPAVKDPANLPAVWNAFNTRFLVGLSFAVNYAIGGLNTFGYHIVNICLHIINTAIVYQFIMLIFQTPYFQKQKYTLDINRIAFYAAMIFLCHPVQTQAVSFITQRAVLMASMCYVSTILLYFKLRLTGQRRYAPMALIFMVMGMLSKENMMTVPLMLLLSETMLFNNQKIEKSIKGLLPFFVVAGLLPFVFWFDQSSSILGLKSQIVSRQFDGFYFLQEIKGLVTYLKLFLWPDPLRHLYYFSDVKTVWEPAVLGSLTMIFIFFMGAIRALQSQRIISYFIFWFFITTLFEIIVQSIVNRAVIYEHWMYLAMVGLSLLMAYLICRIPSKGIMKTVFTIILMALCLLTTHRNEVWKTEIGFWEDTAVKTPHNRTVQFALARAYDRKNDYARAIEHYHKTIEISPENPLAYNNLGVIYLKMGRDGLALENFQEAIALDPGAPAAYNNTGYLYFLKNDWVGALRYYEQSLTHRETPEALFYSGQCYLALNQKKHAQEFLIRAQRLYKERHQDEKVNEINQLLKNIRVSRLNTIPVSLRA